MSSIFVKVKTGELRMKIKEYLQEAVTAEFKSDKRFSIKNGEQVDKHDIKVRFNNKDITMADFIKLLDKKDEDALLVYKSLKDKAREELNISSPSADDIIYFITTFFKAPNGTLDIVIRKGKPVSTDPTNVKKTPEHKITYDEDEIKTGRILHASSKKQDEIKKVEPKKTVRSFAKAASDAQKTA